MRTLGYAAVGAVLAVVVGRLVVSASGVSCHCWLGNLGVGLRAGALGGAFFAFIYDPRLFADSSGQVE